MKLLILTQKVDQNDDVLGFFHRWLEVFAKHAEHVIVICLQEGMHALPKNVQVYSLGKERSVSRYQYLITFFRLIWQQRKNYDVVFVHMNPIYVLLGGLCWYFLKKPIALWYTHKQVDLKLRLAEKVVDRIFTASATSFRLPSLKVRVTGHGIDTEQFSPRPSSVDAKCHLVTTGRISPIKDYETLIRAAAILAKTNMPFEVTLIGDVAHEQERVYLDRLKQLVQKDELETIVHFKGAIPNRILPTELARATVFINMSRTGSLDKAVLEAMALGIPILTSNEAFRDILEEDAALLLFPEGDAQALADKVRVIQTLRAPERKALVERLRGIVVKKHNLERLIPLLLQSYGSS